MPPRIYPKRKPRLFIAEWRDRKGLTQEALGARLETSDVTVSRWETNKRKPDIDALAAIAEALGLSHWTVLTRHPDQPSADDLLRDQPPEVRDHAMKLIRAIRVG